MRGSGDRCSARELARMNGTLVASSRRARRRLDAFVSEKDEPRGAPKYHGGESAFNEVARRIDTSIGGFRSRRNVFIRNAM